MRARRMKTAGVRRVCSAKTGHLQTWLAAVGGNRPFTIRNE
jgi:hypothetical protein